MIDNELHLTSMQLARVAKSLGITQEDISDATGISQSQVSRLLSGHGKHKSKSFLEICNYVNNKQVGISTDLVRQNDEFINALALVWDGTARQSAAIATIIQSLGGICTTSNQKSKQ
jgi:transcriptional regulator with XRE-family HTH domain